MFGPAGKPGGRGGLASQRMCVRFFFLCVPVRGCSRHIYSCVLAFLPDRKLQPEVGNESVGLSSQLIGAIQT